MSTLTSLGLLEDLEKDQIHACGTAISRPAQEGKSQEQVYAVRLQVCMYRVYVMHVCGCALEVTMHECTISEHQYLENACVRKCVHMECNNLFSCMHVCT